VLVELAAELFVLFRRARNLTNGKGIRYVGEIVRPVKEGKNMVSNFNYLAA